MILKLCVVAVVFGVVIVYLNGVNKELASLALVAGSGVMLSLSIDLIKEVFSVYFTLGSLGGVSAEMVKLIIKITLICYVVEFSVGLIEDFGQKSLADKLALVGKIVVLLMATPVLQSLINVIITIVG